MKKVKFPEKCRLFKDITESEFNHLYDCLNGRYVQLKAGERLINENDRADTIAVVISGELKTMRDRPDGKSNLIETPLPNSILGATLSFTGNEIFGLYTYAAVPSEVLIFRASRLPSFCGRACACHRTLMRNLCQVIASRHSALVRRIRVLSERSTAKMVMLYLKTRARMLKSNEFDIPMSRQDFANYLCVDRCALSVELSKLQRKGLIKFYRNHFKLIDQQQTPSPTAA